jgi:phage tail sheath protein FI
MATYQAPGVYVEEVPSAVRPIAGVGTSTAAFIGVAADLSGAWDPKKRSGMPVRSSGEPYEQADALVSRPVNSWTEFVELFGEIQTGNRYLAHAVYGFFDNGGTRCFVARVADAAGVGNGVDAVLLGLEAVDEVAVVAAPLPPDVPATALTAVQSALVAHCGRMQDRVAVLDSVRDVTGDNLVASDDDSGIHRPAADPKGYGAFYFPWVEVADPLGAAGDRVAVPPSGHVAGIYARSDATRGVHKAPANEVVVGALGTRYPVGKVLQGTLNPLGVNCIRGFAGTVKLYGARTLASDPQGDPEWRYVSTRRLVNYLRESIDEGTQWVVFEPNAPDLWSKIRRNVGAFLNSVWATGALLGATPEQAFFVRCDETTNRPEVLEQGQVVIDIGVAIVRPAEFVVFRLSQWAGPAS